MFIVLVKLVLEPIRNVQIHLSSQLPLPIKRKEVVGTGGFVELAIGCNGQTATSIMMGEHGFSLLADWRQTVFHILFENPSEG